MTMITVSALELVVIIAKTRVLRPITNEYTMLAWKRRHLFGMRMVLVHGRGRGQ